MIESESANSESTAAVSSGEVAAVVRVAPTVAEAMLVTALAPGDASAELDLAMRSWAAARQRKFTVRQPREKFGARTPVEIGLKRSGIQWSLNRQQPPQPRETQERLAGRLAHWCYI